MNIPLKNIFIRDSSTGNYKINLFLKYIIIKNFLLKNLNLSDLN